MDRAPSFLRRLSLAFLAVALLSPDASAQPAPRGRGGLWGDWDVKIRFGEREMESILSFSREPGGEWKGYWISLFGMSELKDLKFGDGKLSFVQEFRGRDGETVRSTFAGTVEEGKLSGTISGPMGETEVEGARAPMPSRISGIYELKMRRGEREFTSTLVVKGRAGGELAAEMKSERVEHAVSDVKSERGSLSFKVRSTMGDREWESTFEGKVEGDALTGTLKSERGEVAVQGTRAGGPAIGTWVLDVSSDRGAGKQRLRVNPDLSAVYGATRVERVTLDGDKLGFKIVREFGDRKFEMTFQATIADGKLTGEVATAMGTQKVSGTKVVRPPRERRV
ncbi:MAG: hypothetical protein ACUVYA_11690 [Planctomycetota bacterium]